MALIAEKISMLDSERTHLTVSCGKNFRLPREVPESGQKISAKEFAPGQTLVITAFADDIVASVYNSDQIANKLPDACPLPRGTMIIDRVSGEFKVFGGSSEVQSVTEWALTVP